MKKAEIKCLTGLRFPLAVWVILLHRRNSPRGWAYGLLHYPLWRFIDNGALAVSGFFCLSGFILAYNYSTRLGTSPDKERFISARFARIYPAYLLGLILMLPFVVDEVLHSELPALPAAAALISSLTLVQSFGSPENNAIWNPPGWSLSAEWFFYLTLPLYAAKLHELNTRRLAIILLVSMFVAFGVFCYGDKLSLSSMNPVVRIPEFISGYVCGLIYLRHGSFGKLVSGLGFIASLLIILVGSGLLPPGRYDGLFLASFLVLIYSLINPPLLVCWLMGNPVALFLGEASYGMYIFHSPLTVYCTYLDQKLLKTNLSQHHPIAMLLLFFLTVIAFSGLSLYFVEHPLRRRLAPWLVERLSYYRRCLLGLKRV